MTVKRRAMAGVAALMALVAPVEAQFHLALTSASLSGPGGASGRAHVGDEMTLRVQVWNWDEFYDSITVNSVRLVIHHGQGDVVIPNLLPGPAIAPFYGDFVEASASFVVQPDDGDLLTIEYEVQGTDNWDGTSPGVPLSFSQRFSSGVLILKPAIEVAQECQVSPGYPAVAFGGFITNTGNALLNDVVIVSDSGTPDDPSDDWSHSLGALGPGAVAPYSGSFTASLAAVRSTVTARGTDALGLTVTNFNTREIPTGELPTLSIRRAGASAVRISWPDWAEGFRLESTETVDRDWAPVTEVPTSVEGARAVTLTMSNHRFFRLTRPTPP